jgi:hypothetical protein
MTLDVPRTPKNNGGASIFRVTTFQLESLSFAQKFGWRGKVGQDPVETLRRIRDSNRDRQVRTQTPAARNPVGGSGSGLDFRLARPGACISGCEHQAYAGKPIAPKTKAPADKVGRRGRTPALGLRSCSRMVARPLKPVALQSQTFGITNT